MHHATRLCRGKYHFDISTLTLELTVPQAFVNELEAGYASPESWDRGVNAFYTSYYASQYYSDYKSAGNNKSTFARFTSGLNLLDGNCTLTPAITIMILAPVSGKVTPLSGARLRRDRVRCALAICTHQAIYSTLCAFAGCAYIAICRCCPTPDATLRRSSRDCAKQCPGHH
jgi:hypothetical protein